MSVRKVGSKLAQGVRQLKAQQESVPTVAAVAEVATVAEAKPIAKTVTPRVAAKPKANKLTSADTNKAGMQHPDRVWPD